MIQEITIPEIGEKIESGKVVGVLVSTGDTVDIDQPLIEFETDKAVVEIPSTAKGTVTEISVKNGDEVRIGQVIVRIETDSESASTQKQPQPEPEKPPVSQDRAATAESETAAPKSRPAPKGIEKESAKPIASASPDSEETTEDSGEETPEPRQSEELHEPAEGEHAAPASPSVRRLARELGADINEVRGTGPGGRITVEDVKAHVKKIVTGHATAEPGGFGESSREGRALPDFSKWGDIRREPMSRVRSITADSTGYAWNVIPHVTQFDRADISEVEGFRRKYAKAAEKAGGKLTVTAILLKVIAAALRKYPKFNASIDPANQEIIYKDYCHLGMAVDTDRGLLVPVIRDVDRKSIIDLSAELTDIADRTRNKKIKPEELEGGTFTISNQGSIGGVDFTPIVYWPQVAILGVSRSSVQPTYIDGELKPRTILPLSLSYDHRLIDGADAARFLNWVVQALEHPLLVLFED